MVEYLLSRRDIKVTIVNNKGQSVLSLAASHGMPETILKRIQHLEKEDTTGWWNFRASHSDGYEYGDLDPRFLDRPLRETDTVSVYAINGTTKRSRKGGFERRNPEAAIEWKNHKQQQYQSKHKKNQIQGPFQLSLDEQAHMDHAWEVLGNCNNVEEKDYQGALLTIVRLNDQLRQAWIPETASRLVNLQFDPNEIPRILSVSMNDIEPRVESLLQKLLAKLLGDPNTELNEKDISKEQRIDRIHHQAVAVDTVIDLKKFRSILSGLDISFLESSEKSNICLPTCPAWIDDIESLTTLFGDLQLKLRQTTVGTVLAIDTEWYQEENTGLPAVSTLQLALYNSSSPTTCLSSFVIDLLPSDVEYYEMAKLLIGRFILLEDELEDSNTGQISSLNHWILGFSLGHDLSMLQSFCKMKTDDHEKSLMRHDNVVDLQSILSNRYFESNKSQLPGLQRCVELFSDWSLSKEEQRSDWSLRPLSLSQLDYAGLDAAILVALLAEESRK